ncbi:hypothetical protein [Salipaludibacillus sp. CF4.18]|uniref:hypothetical protein n=1 Tax=Salipaludibacillus sp. CF4.18 TaxID=3373081 RepID=UPI003EE7D4E6
MLLIGEKQILQNEIDKMKVELEKTTDYSVKKAIRNDISELYSVINTKSKELVR